MSNYTFTARHKETGDKAKVHALDDYFDRRVYGYRMPDGDVLTHDRFIKEWERVDDKRTSDRDYN